MRTTSTTTRRNETFRMHTSTAWSPILTRTAKGKRKFSQARPAYRIIEASHHLVDVYVCASLCCRLQDILEGHRTISELPKLLRRIPVVRALRQLALPLLVDSLVIEDQH